MFLFTYQHVSIIISPCPPARYSAINCYKSAVALKVARCDDVDAPMDDVDASMDDVDADS